jgi:hypothetical protein
MAQSHLRTVRNIQLIPGFNEQFGKNYFITETDKLQNELYFIPVYNQSIENSIFTYTANYDGKKTERHFCQVLLDRRNIDEIDDLELREEDFDSKIFFFGKLVYDAFKDREFEIFRRSHLVRYYYQINRRVSKFPVTKLYIIDEAMNVTPNFLRNKIAELPFTLKQLHKVLVDKKVDANFVNFPDVKSFFYGDI